MKTTHALAVACCGLAATAVTAQTSRNVALLATLDPARPGSEYNDIWGYVDPTTGKEYCLLGSEDGTHIIDCSDPRQPVQRAMIPTERTGSSNTWRDIKTVGQYAYVVSEAHAGMQIIDLTTPDSPAKVGVFGANLWSHAHNIGADQDAGLVLVCGTDNGTHIIDVASNPASPTRIFRLGSPYMHDLSAQDGVGYFCDQNGNRLRLYDMSQLPNALPQLGNARMPGSAIAHAAWPSRDGNLCVTANEVSGGPVAIFDTRNKQLPRLIATYRANNSGSAIPHNVFFRDRIVHMSHYTEGYRALDASDGAHPIEVGYYDMWGGPSSGYNGAWGCYHNQPSGIQYVSSIDAGLFILKPKAAATRYGVATTGSAGATPTIHAVGAAFIGNHNFRLEVDDAAPGLVGALVLGSGRGSTAVGALAVNVALSPVAPILVAVTTDAGGAASVSVPVPNDASLDGGIIDAQFVLADSAAPLDLSGTRGLEFELFNR